VILRVVTATGAALAGAAVNLYQTLRQWTPPCSDQGYCPAAPVLERQTAKAVDGLVTFIPLANNLLPPRLEALAATGSSATLTISIDRHL
jgi:hypothetical protein